MINEVPGTEYMNLNFKWDSSQDETEYGNILINDKKIMRKQRYRRYHLNNNNYALKKRVYHEKYSEKNAENKKIDNKKYYEKNVESILNNRRDYYENNKESKLKKMKRS